MKLKNFFTQISIFSLIFVASTYSMQQENINTPFNQQKLLEAISRGNYPAITTFLQQGLNPNYFYRGTSPLIDAIIHNNPDFIKLLLSAGADPNLIEPQSGNNALLYRLGVQIAIPLTSPLQMIEIKKRKNDIIAMLIPITNLAHQNNNGKTALMFIVSDAEYASLLDLMLQQPNININAQDNNGWTALMHAASSRSIDAPTARAIIKKLLLVPDININIENYMGDTALDLSANRKTIAKMLTDAGAAHGSYHARPHPYARPSGMPGSRPAPTPAPAQPRPMPAKTLDEQLIEAMQQKKDVNIINQLLQAGANPNIMVGRNPLLIEAITINNLPAIQALIASPKINPQTLLSALLFALNLVNLKVVYIITHHPGFNINAESSEKRTILDYAMAQPIPEPERTNLINYLRSRGAKTASELHARGQEAPAPRPSTTRPKYSAAIYTLLQVPENASPYQILHIAPNATDAEVKQAWRQLSLQWHPDRNPDIKEDAAEVSKLLNQAVSEIEVARRRKIR